MTKHFSRRPFKLVFPLLATLPFISAGSSSSTQNHQQQVLQREEQELKNSRKFHIDSKGNANSINDERNPEREIEDSNSSPSSALERSTISKTIATSTPTNSCIGAPGFKCSDCLELSHCGDKCKTESGRCIQQDVKHIGAE